MPLLHPASQSTVPSSPLLLGLFSGLLGRLPPPYEALDAPTCSQGFLHWRRSVTSSFSAARPPRQPVLSSSTPGHHKLDQYGTSAIPAANGSHDAPAPGQPRGSIHSLAPLTAPIPRGSIRPPPRQRAVDQSPTSASALAPPPAIVPSFASSLLL